MGHFLKIIFILFIFVTLQAKPSERVSLQLQYFHQFQFAGYYIAKEKGYYEDAHIELDFHEFKVGINPIDEVMSNRATFAIGRSSLIAQRSKGKKIVALAAILQSTPSVIMIKKSSGIKSIEEFKGKTINIIGTEFSDSIHALLLSKNIDFSDMVVQKSSDRFEKLLDDRVHIITGYTSNQPYMFKQLGVDIKIFDPKDYGFDFYSEILYTNEDKLIHNHEMVHSFIQASLKGWEYAFNNIDETVELILKKYNTQNKTREALVYEANVLKKLAYLNSAELGEIKFEKIKRNYSLFSIMGLIENEVDVKKFIFNHDNFNFPIALSNDEKEYLKKKKELKVCVKSDWLPYESIEDGKFIGISADFLNIISKSLDVDLKIIPSATKQENVKLLKERKCDIKPIMSLNGEKHIPYKQTEAYMEDQFTLTSKIKEPFIMNLNNYLNKKYVIVQAHYALKKILEKKYPSIKIVAVNNIKEALGMVVKDEAFGYFGQSLASSHHIQMFYPLELKIVNDLENFTLGFGVVNDDEILLNIFNRAIHIIKKDSKRSILNKWKSIVVHKYIDYTFVWKLVISFITILSIIIFFLFRQNRLKKIILEQKNTFENLFQKSTDGILLIRDNKFYDCNESVVSMLGYKSKDEFLNTHPSELSPMFQADGKLSYDKSQEMDKIAYENGSNTFEWLHKKANGDIFWVQVVLTKINLNNYDILHVTWRDIHRKKELEVEILEINKNLAHRVKLEVGKNIEKDKQLLQQSKLAQMGEMVSMIAHQWRQPLGAIASTGIDMQLKISLNHYDFSDEKEIKKCLSEFSDGLNDIEDYVQSLTHIIDDFRDFYKPSNKSVDTTIDRPTKKAAKIINGSFINHDIKIENNFTSTAKISIYESEIMQVILNILQNSKDNFKEKEISNQTITIDSYDTQSSVILKICDNGGGISSEIMDDIYNPYFSTKSEINGTGLGLYMSKMIIEEHHHGKLYAENNDNGVCFSIELPKKV